MNSVRVGLLGLGTVGQGTVRVLTDNASEIARRAGRHIEVVSAAVRDLDKAKSHGFDIDIHGDPQAIVDDPSIAIVCELMGGTELSLNLVLRAIENGKHVVTANKALIALHGNQIFAAAQEKGVSVAFEPAVAGGIPVIKAIREGLAGNDIQWLAGIINGTGNFILTEMHDKGRDFADVLADAQALGYAEADPTFDVEGIDAAHKLTILASIAFGVPLQFDAVYTEGISAVTAKDVAYADELGYSVKHLGIARKSEDGVQLRVHPTLIPKSQLIANVDGVMNAVLVHSDAVGPTLYYGAGAGSGATASAVVADIIDVVRLLSAAPEHSVPYLAFQANELSDLPVLPPEQIVTAYYLRLQAEDKPGVMADVTRILADHGVSLKSILQKKADSASAAEVILMTHRVQEADMNAAIAQINGLSSILADVCRMRVEALD
ncbi:MAG: homoserine dehydrogenase [Granulosicoccaceae bacterium]